MTFHLILLVVILNGVTSLRIRGEWTPSKERIKVVTKFGFQQLDPFDKLNSRGFVFGNVTARSHHKSTTDNSTSTLDRATFILVPETQISSLYSDSFYAQSCSTMLQNVTDHAFDATCFPKGTADVMRWVPCPAGMLCEDEDDATKVVPGHQMTMRVEEPTMPEYWFVVMVACTLNDQCNWTNSQFTDTISYDLWLTNGNPVTEGAYDQFTKQFSFDEQNLAEIYFVALMLYIILVIFQVKAVALIRQSVVPARIRLLSWIIALKTVGLTLQSLNLLVFSWDGVGVSFAKFSGEVLRVIAICLLCLLLILLARGWSLSDYDSSACNKPTLIFWGILTGVQVVVFTYNFIYAHSIVEEEIDIFRSWPGYVVLVTRIIQAMWFLSSVRLSINRELNEERAVFLAHFGAASLVWFVYLSALGVIASFISLLWRFKIILGIRTFANFAVIACLVHLFWPSSTNRRFFLSDRSVHRQVDQGCSTEMEEFEKLIICNDEIDTDDGFVDDDKFKI
uniref:GpcrRhopsn4 domain-containing protein n=1 Tax=Steinernema glaseri TaxID=37863 RepID=A0A1I7ZVI5_9BILA